MYHPEDKKNYIFNDFDCKKNVNIFKVYGKGVISVKPSIAEVTAGVITENVRLEIAQKENARITNQVINSIIELGVERKNIQTSSYNIRANYDYINGKQVFSGYEVNNNLTITITNINSAGEIIDTAVKNGANTISGITFFVSNEKLYYYQALSMAVVDAQNKADVMANKLNVKLNDTPIEISELPRENIVPLQTMTFKATSAATPIEAGENKIEADIEAVFHYNE